MSSLVIPSIECVESAENFGRFQASPLEKGVGITLGNSLRRILLGYLPGAAVTRVKIDGIQHEFSVILHAKEDAMEFLLNVKALRLKPLSETPGKLVLDAHGQGRVCAADIKPSVDFEIANPELCLATLSSPEARLYVEFDVELDAGFRTAESTDDMPVGTIPVDAIFSPIKKINFNVEPTHIGREISHERLSLDVWTDGTISPIDAVSQGAALLIEQLKPFVDYANVSQMKEEERLIRLSIPDEKYNMSVEQLDLSVRTINCLDSADIATVGELIAKGPKELLKLRNFGQRSLQEIEDKLEGMGLSLTPNIKESQKEASPAQEEELPEPIQEETDLDKQEISGETDEPDKVKSESGESQI